MGKKCPHCLTAFNSKDSSHELGIDPDGAWVIAWSQCPECNRLIVRLLSGIPKHALIPRGFGGLVRVKMTRLVYPKGSARAACPPEVPKDLAQDYHEACLVIADSPKASAALSRRCLQHLTEDHLGIKKRTLADEIQAVIESGQLPSHLSEAIDAIRNIGNFSAHPMKSQHSGEILPVEPGEAEWTLDTLESLFDFCFVQPARLKAKQDALNKKLVDAGKPPMKK